MSDRPTGVSRRDVLGGLTTIGALSIAGCSSLPVGGSNSTAPVWRQDISDASTASPLAVANGQLIVGAQDKALHGFDARGGERSFRFETGGPIEAQPAVPEQGGPYHVHSTDGDLYAVSPAGSRLWQSEGVHERGMIARSGSLLVALDPSGDHRTIRGLDAKSGDERFERAVNTYRLTGFTDELLIVPVPTSADQVRVAALSKRDGSVQWQTDAQSYYPSIVPTGEIVLTVQKSTVTAREPSDGSVRWQTEVGEMDSYRPPALGEQVYLRSHPPNSDSEVVALDRNSGKIEWRRSSGYQIEWVEPTPDGVFVGSEVNDPDGGILARVDCFELDGSRRWKTVTEAPTMEELVVFENLVVCSAERELVAVERDTGETRWRYEPESYSRLSLATHDDSLFVSYIDDGAVAQLPTE